jgi:hypothetical protein
VIQIKRCYIFILKQTIFTSVLNVIVCESGLTIPMTLLVPRDHCIIKCQLATVGSLEIASLLGSEQDSGDKSSSENGHP